MRTCIFCRKRNKVLRILSFFFFSFKVAPESVSSWWLKLVVFNAAREACFPIRGDFPVKDARPRTPYARFSSPKQKETKRASISGFASLFAGSSNTVLGNEPQFARSCWHVITTADRAEACRDGRDGVRRFGVTHTRTDLQLLRHWKEPFFSWAAGK